MRLIDADNITITRQEYVGALTLKERLQRLLKFQPTVKAMPIEWVEKWVDMLKERNYHSYQVLMPALIEMLEDWEKENE